MFQVNPAIESGDNMMLRSKKMLPEWMDQHDITEQDYHGAMVALGTLNAWSRTAQILCRHVSRFVRNTHEFGKGQTLLIHDYGCGDGDLSVRLSRCLQTRGIAHRIVGFDANARGIERGRARFCSANNPHLELQTADVLALDAPCDIAISSLFMHHLIDSELTTLLQKTMTRASVGLIFTDLRRCYGGLALAYLATRCLTTSGVARNDGPISVRNSRTCHEMLSLARQAGMRDVRVHRSWPSRMVLAWQAQTAAAFNKGYS